MKFKVTHKTTYTFTHYIEAETAAEAKALAADMGEVHADETSASTTQPRAQKVAAFPYQTKIERMTR